MLKRFVIVMLLAAMMSTVGLVSLTAQDSIEVGPITQAIIDRDELICGVNASLTGFGVVNDAGEYVGFDVDFCRAIAAAILGDATKVSFRPLTGAERQAAIQGGEIDMMSRNTTWTLSRDTEWGVIYAPTTFFDGQGIGVRAESGITSIEELDGAAVCVQRGTTTELNIADAFASRGLDYEPVPGDDGPSTFQAYLDNRCDAWTTDKSGIVSYHATSPNPGEHAILDINLSKEPLGPLSPQSDPQFAEIIAWTIYGMMNAEEFGITSENVGEYLESDNPEIQRLLGIGDNASGSYLGIANDFMVTVLEQVGNYGEVYERNLGELVPERGLNALYIDGSLLYPMPFR